MKPYKTERWREFNRITMVNQRRMSRMMKQVLREAIRIVSINHKLKNLDIIEYIECLLVEVNRIAREQTVQINPTPNAGKEEEEIIQEVEEMVIGENQPETSEDEVIEPEAIKDEVIEPESIEDEASEPEAIGDQEMTEELPDSQTLMNLTLDNEEQDELAVTIPFDKIFLYYIL